MALFEQRRLRAPVRDSKLCLPGRLAEMYPLAGSRTSQFLHQLLRDLPLRTRQQTAMTDSWMTAMVSLAHWASPAATGRIHLYARELGRAAQGLSYAMVQLQPM